MQFYGEIVLKTYCLFAGFDYILIEKFYFEWILVKKMLLQEELEET